MITAVNGRLLVELKGAYKHLNTTRTQFDDSKMRGVVKSIAKDIEADCKQMGIKLGSMVYFGKYEDTARYKLEGNDHILIKLEEIGGVEDASN